IISAFEYMEFPSYNIDPKDVDYAFMYQKRKLEKTVIDTNELRRRQEYLNTQSRICLAAAKRSDIFERILEYHRKKISFHSSINVLQHFKEYFSNFRSDIIVFVDKAWRKPFSAIFYFISLVISQSKNLFILVLKNLLEFLQSIGFLKMIRSSAGLRVTNFTAMILSLVFVILLVTSIKYLFVKAQTVWKDFTTDISKPVEELQTGYVKSNYIIAKDRENHKEILAIPFGTKLHYRKVSINAEKYALYIQNLDAYIYDEELSSTEPSQVQSKICIFFLSDSKFVPQDKYKKEIPTVKIELFSEHYRIFDEKGTKTEEGYYQIKKNYIVLRSGNRSSMMKYLGDGYFDSLISLDI
ncbi:MAG TPA: hypothetical protein PK453_26835, partial [Leptospiraceae bacterium]|nr:hypothetical protein [Leptospiraceae bacterium]